MIEKIIMIFKKNIKKDYEEEESKQTEIIIIIIIKEVMTMNSILI